MADCETMSNSIDCAIDTEDAARQMLFREEDMTQLRNHSQVRDRMGILNPETVDALNMLLEDVRASVEIEVALSNGATEYLEREALTQMGLEDTEIAFLMRNWLESLELPVTRRINGIVLQALDLTRYDDRLLLFVHHQLASREQAARLLAENEFDSEGSAILRSIADAHTRHAAWCEQRAKEFAETRQFEFRRLPGRTGDPNSSGAGGATGPEISGEHNAPQSVASIVADPGIDDASERENPSME